MYPAKDASPRVLVTGAGRGIGRALATARFARGDQVIGTGRDERGLARTAALCERLPGEFVGHSLDVCEESAVRGTVQAAGPFDICVAIAGVAEVRPFLETRPNDLRRILEVNLIGAAETMRVAAATMVDAGRLPHRRGPLRCGRYRPSRYGGLRRLEAWAARSRPDDGHRVGRHRCRDGDRPSRPGEHRHPRRLSGGN